METCDLIILFALLYERLVIFPQPTCTDIEQQRHSTLPGLASL